MARGLLKALGVGNSSRQRSRHLRFVRQDPREPRHELARCVEGVTTLDRREERRLDDVLRLRLVMGEMPRDLQQLLARPIEHLCKRVEISVPAESIEQLLESGMVHRTPLSRRAVWTLP